MYLLCFILEIFFKFNDHLFSILIGATLKGKNMLPPGSTFFSFGEALLTTEFSQRVNQFYCSTFIIDANTCINILYHMTSRLGVK